LIFHEVADKNKLTPFLWLTVYVLLVFYYLIKYAACQWPPGPLLFNKLDLT